MSIPNHTRHRQTPTVEQAVNDLQRDGFLTWDITPGRFDIVMIGVANRLERPIAVWQQQDDDRRWFWRLGNDSDQPAH